MLMGVNTVKAIYPGSFDPLTNGHLDLIARAARIFDHLVVAILRNSAKEPLFTVEERVAMLSEGVAEFDNVSVSTFDGLLVEFAREERAQAVVRGIRATSKRRMIRSPICPSLIGVCPSRMHSTKCLTIV